MARVGTRRGIAPPSAAKTRPRADGKWVASDTIIPALLSCMLTAPYFSLPPPKSTGTDYFNLSWLTLQLADLPHTSQDVQATLTELTARSITATIDRGQAVAGVRWRGSQQPSARALGVSGLPRLEAAILGGVYAAQ